ncbi:death ligand signal enhancer isoform X1 [Astyanax mexicanus]|uniref:death ligand signal enhancer isoform X1 n=1 Tax=Astyanax mexicanus TaxID=7994 RepID=UPI0020CB5B4F|nr:death ligand signal enhancer isoform X1 [Astyanax mexicanus]
MWRVHGLLGRVLSRCHGNGPLRISNGHHVEDSSTVLSGGRHGLDSSSQRGEDGEQKKNRRRRRTSQFCYAGLARYSALDAVGWGAAAVLFMQLCRRIHSQFSSVGDQNPGPARLRESGLIHKCSYRVLLDILSRRDVLPGGVSVLFLKGALPSPDQRSSSDGDAGVDGGVDGVEGGADGVNGAQNFSSSSNTEPSPDLQPSHPHHHQQGVTLSYSATVESSAEFDVLGAAGRDQSEESRARAAGLDEAVQNLRDVMDHSVPIILNIMGLESVKVGDYETAFECFLASAQQDYSKAQFNTGVCYERGRGVHKDLSKALQYYRRAAAAGHRQAQYRCAKLLLNSRGRSDSDTATAHSLLHKAAAAGLTEAQLYLGVVLSEEAESDGGECVQYFRMAAESGDSTGLLFLGQCYERGLGVPQCFSSALSLYQQAAAKGNQKAKNTLRDLHSREVLRSIRSAPCLSILDQLHLTAMFPQVSEEAGPAPKQQTNWPTQPLPHSWSTGDLLAPPPFPVGDVNSNGSSGGWIIGVG